MGRPPLPIEHHRRVGRANGGKKADGRPLPARGQTVVLPAAAAVPPCPPDFAVEGRALWGRAWGAATAWLSPASDWAAVAEACRLADDVAAARAAYRSSGNPHDGRLLAALSTELRAALAALGFDPAGRARLAVAEVTRAGKLETLRAQKGEGM